MTGIEKRMSHYKNYYSRVILKKMLDNGGRLQPQYDPKAGGFVYGGLNPDRIKKTISELIKGQLIRATQITSACICPFHGETAFHVLLRCKRHKAPLERKELAEHFPCGYISPSDAFKKGGELVCPKCGLKVKGTELKRLGVWFSCRVGHENVSDPEIVLYCLAGNHEILMTETDLIERAEYEINTALLDEIKFVLSFYDALMEILENKGYNLVEPVVKGASGVEHTFDLVMKNPNGKTFVLDAFFSEQEVSEVVVVSFLTKIYDVRPEKAAFVAVPSVSSMSLGMLNSLGVYVLVAPTIHEAKERLSELIL